MVGSTFDSSQRVPMTGREQTAPCRRGHVVGTGFVALDRIHVGTTRPLFEELGGSCGNVLISLAMLGRPVVPLLLLGMDPVGARLERDLRLAGADTHHVARVPEVHSPVVVELLDPASGDHRFSSAWPESKDALGAFEPITRRQLDTAKPLVTSCAIFYSDRVSGTICEAMEAAAAGGAIVYFEPSSIGDPELFDRALATAHILKCSTERLPSDVIARLRPEAFGVVTAGERGLELHHDGRSCRFPAHEVEALKDACGSGDMVTVGLIDTLLQSWASCPSALSIASMHAGIVAGQRLAAANCAHVGARGLFREWGAPHARSILAEVAAGVGRREP